MGHLVWPKQYASRRGFLTVRHEQAYLLAKGQPPCPSTPLPDVQPWAYSGNVHYPTEKAEFVIRPLVAAFSIPGAIVLDPFTGSGSTGVACARFDRRFIGIELDKVHHATAMRRTAEAYRQADITHMRSADRIRALTG